MVPAVPILMYHGVADDPARAVRSLAVRPSMFAAQLAHLRALGFTPVTLSSLLEGLRPELAHTEPAHTQRPPPERALPERPIVLAFDDGYADFHREALPLLDEYGFPATLFVTTGWIEDAGPYDAGGRPDRMLTWSQIDEAVELGTEIGGHTHSHPQLDQLPGRQLGIELRQSKELLEDRLGKEVRSLAYPYGYSSARVRRAVRDAGYAYACAVGNTTPGRDGDLLAVPRLTIRRSTSLATFDRVVRTRYLPLIYLADRTLTKGWAAVRRTRYVLGRAHRRD